MSSKRLLLPWSFFGIFGLIALSVVYAQFAPNEICYICSTDDPNLELANPDNAVDISFLGLTDITTVSCQQLLNSGTSGFIPTELCEQAQQQAILDDCGCPSIPDETSTNSTQSPGDGISQPPNNEVSSVTTTRPSGNITQQPSDTTTTITPTLPPSDAATMSNQTVSEIPSDKPSDKGSEAPSNMVTTSSPVQTSTGIPASVIPSNLATTIVPRDTESSPPSDAVSSEVTTVIGEELTLFEVIDGQTDLSFLTRSIEDTGLSEELDTGTYTVFGPIDAAFNALNDTDLETLFKPEYVLHLQNILLYHVVSGSYLSSNISEGETEAVMMNNETVTLTKSESGSIAVSYPNYDGTVTSVNVIESDLKASNGAVHKVDGIMFPKFVFTRSSTILSSDYSILSELVTAAFPSGLPSGHYTFFAPTNDAFLALGDETIAYLKDPNNIAVLTGILVNHVAPGVFPSVLMKTGDTITTVGDWVLQITESDSIIKVNGATIIKADQLAFDGIVHGIDSVLLESSLDINKPVFSAPPSDISSKPPSDSSVVILTDAPTFTPSDTDVVNLSDVPTSTPSDTVSTLPLPPSTSPVTDTGDDLDTPVDDGSVDNGSVDDGEDHDGTSAGDANDQGITDLLDGKEYHSSKSKQTKKKIKKLGGRGKGKGKSEGKGKGFRF